MSTTRKRSPLTSAEPAQPARPRLELEFSAFVRRVSDLSAKDDVELYFEHVSSAVTSAAAESRHAAIDIKGQLSEALSHDVGCWIGEVKQVRSSKGLVRMLEQLRDESGHSRVVFFDHLLGALLDR